MIGTGASARRRGLALLASVATALALTAGFAALPPAGPAARLLLAPMIGVMAPCILPAASPPKAVAAKAPPSEGCAGPHGSAATLIESTLAGVGPQISPGGEFELGYTLQIPLLEMFTRSDAAGAGGWAIDRDAVRRVVRTLKDNPRPAIVYLFSTHFGVGAPIEAELARDLANLAATRDGPMAPDRYYTLDIYPWSIATTGNAITRRRGEAIDAVVDEICRLPAKDRDKIRGLTLLGEVHQLFPDFEAGMGFAPPYRVSDYSATSVKDFRELLKLRFGDIAALNAHLGMEPRDAWRSFDAVDPPSKNIRSEPLARFTDHIDSFAQGTLPISGWAAPNADGTPRWIRIYLNGEPLARVPANLSRQDVRAALPALGTADVGWRFDLDFAALPPGGYRIDLMMEQGAAVPPGAAAPRLLHLGTRQISLMGRGQQPPAALPMRALPASDPAGADANYFIDQPPDQSAYWFNPLVPLWHAFRNQQVVRYLDWADRRVGRSCLWDTPRYMHQIVPYANPGWDANKFAVDASLKPRGGIRLGVSLYGEPTYGASFFRRLAASREDRFGVTEFHPLSAMTPAATRAMLERLRAHGAAFVSFFLEPRFGGRRLDTQMNIFSLDPANPKFGSDALYRSMRELMRGQDGHDGKADDRAKVER